MAVTLVPGDGKLRARSWPRQSSWHWSRTMLPPGRGASMRDCGSAGAGRRHRDSRRIVGGRCTRSAGITAATRDDAACMRNMPLRVLLRPSISCTMLPAGPRCLRPPRLERWFRDVLGCTQHIAASTSNYEMAGAFCSISTRERSGSDASSVAHRPTRYHALRLMRSSK
jgi:hypothetical protein